jgi:hypothetical protein
MHSDQQGEGSIRSLRTSKLQVITLWPKISLFFLGGRYFAKFQPEKYDLDPFKGFSMEKVAQIHQISNIFFPQIARFLW